MFLHKARAAAVYGPVLKSANSPSRKIPQLTCHPTGRKGKDNDSKLLALLDDNEPWWTHGKLYKCPFEEETMV